MQRLQIRSLGHQCGAENGFNLGRKNETAVLEVIIKRLNPQAIARRKQLTLPGIKDRESEHTVQLVKALFVPVLVGVQQDLRVGSRPQANALGQQFLTKFFVVVDLSVKDNPQV